MLNIDQQEHHGNHVPISKIVDKVDAGNATMLIHCAVRRKKSKK